MRIHCDYFLITKRAKCIKLRWCLVEDSALINYSSKLNFLSKFLSSFALFLVNYLGMRSQPLQQHKLLLGNLRTNHEHVILPIILLTT